jgi:hypothetical protein
LDILFDLTFGLFDGRIDRSQYIHPNVIVFQRLVAEEPEVLSQMIDELLCHLDLQRLTILGRNVTGLDDLRLAHGLIVPLERTMFSASWA